MRSLHMRDNFFFYPYFPGRQGILYIKIRIFLFFVYPFWGACCTPAIRLFLWHYVIFGCVNAPAYFKMTSECSEYSDRFSVLSQKVLKCQNKQSQSKPENQGVPKSANYWQRCWLYHKLSLYRRKVYPKLTLTCKINLLVTKKYSRYFWQKKKLLWKIFIPNC